MSAGLLILTAVHVIISLAGIASGFVVMWGFLKNKSLPQWTTIFLSTTMLTSATGFLFPIEHFTPGLAMGILSLLILGVALVARYRKHLAGRWCATFVICASLAQYFNSVILIIQSFQKVPPLHALAPTQPEPIFLITQLVVLVSFVAFTVAAVLLFRSRRQFHSRESAEMLAVS